MLRTPEFQSTRNLPARSFIPMGKHKMKFQQLALFEASLLKANKVLKLIGLETDDEETNQTMFKRVLTRRYFCFCTIMLYSELLGEIAWFVAKGIIGDTFIEATYTLPCVFLCILGTIKTYYRIKYGPYINDLIHSLRRLQTNDYDSEIHKNPTAYEAIPKIVRTLDMAIKALTIFNTCVMIAFLLGTVSIMAFIYFTTGEVQLRLPFLILYPFDPFDLRIYPFIYIHQSMVGIFAVLTVFGPDCLYYVFCTFIQIQFCSLQYDMERIIPLSSSVRRREITDICKKKLKACFARHRELIRCVNLTEAIHCKSALFNFFSSSLLICLTGFNVVAYEDLAMLGNFLSFLVLCLVQIYLICYYADNVSRSSVELSNAIYRCQWYNVDAKVAKDLMMVLTRAQKPCNLTAYSFIEINLNTFTRILSNSWSYFALLQSLYNRRINE